MEFAELSTTSNEAIRVLCLDDETNVIRSLNRLFRQNGIHAELCSDPQQALALIRDSSFEVVISDMRMPEMDGATFLHEVKRICPDTQRILLTGYSDSCFNN